MSTRSLELPKIRQRSSTDGAAPTRARGPVVWRLGIALTGVLLVASAVLAFLTHRADGRAEERDQAVAEASRRLPLLLSYDHSTLDADLDRAVAQTTGDFHDDYVHLLDTVVRKTATRFRVDTTAVVNGIGVVSSEEERVVVLAFVTQQTTKPGSAPVTSGSRVEVTMVPDGGDWLISDLKPL